MYIALDTISSDNNLISFNKCRAVGSSRCVAESSKKRNRAASGQPIISSYMIQITDKRKGCESVLGVAAVDVVVVVAAASPLWGTPPCPHDDHQYLLYSQVIPLMVATLVPRMD